MLYDWVPVIATGVTATSDAECDASAVHNERLRCQRALWDVALHVTRWICARVVEVVRSVVPWKFGGVVARLAQGFNVSSARPLFERADVIPALQSRRLAFTIRFVVQPDTIAILVHFLNAVVHTARD